MSFIVKGKTLKIPYDNIDTDVIIPARYLVHTEPEVLAKHAMEPLIPNFYEKAREGVILITGRNFGMGSSREQAAIALKAAGVKAIIAESFARIFYRNAINNGLPVLMIPQILKLVNDGDEVEINLNEGKVIIRGEVELKTQKLSEKVLEILKCGGLIPYLRKVLGIER